MIPIGKNDPAETCSDADYLDLEAPDRPRLPSARRPIKRGSSPRKPPPRRPSATRLTVEDRDAQHSLRRQPSRRPPPRRRPPHPPSTRTPATTLAGEGKATDPLVSRAGYTPIERLKAAARGHEDLLPGDIQRILLDHLADAHDRVKELDDHAGTFLKMLTTPPVKGEKLPDPGAILSVMDKLEVTRDRRTRELARLAELIYRISSPSRPQLQVVAAAAQVNVGRRVK